MKTLALVTLFMFMTTACAAHGCFVLRDDPARVEASLRSTVGFVKLRDADEIEEEPELGRWDRPYCSGFFISPTILVSATHCFREEKRIEIPGLGTIVLPVETQYVGKKVSFIRYGQINDDNRVTSRPSEARILFADEDEDVAILRLSSGRKSSYYFPLAADLPQLGETIYITGHPVGLTWSFTTGIVTRVWRRSTAPHQYVQTQAVSFFGNSGGPVFNERGEVVAVVHALIGRQSTINLNVGVGQIRKALKKAMQPRRAPPAAAPQCLP